MLEDWDKIVRKTNASDEEGVLVQFYKKPVENKAKSKEKERPVFDEVIYVKIIAIGQKHSVVDRKMKEEDKVRFPTYWAKFEADDDEVVGHPIGEWQGVSRTRAMELKHQNVPTVEALASLPDAVLAKVGADAFDLRKAAQKFLEGDDELTVLEEKIKVLTQKITELEGAKANPAPKPRGRPRKKVADEPSDSSTNSA